MPRVASAHSMPRPAPAPLPPPPPKTTTATTGSGGDTFEAKRVDGNAFCKRTLADLRARVANGEKCRVVFDIDDTLVDTRGRTLAIAKAWDAEKGTKTFARLTLSKVGKTPQETCKALGLSEGLTKAFSGYWNVRFFGGALFAEDLALPKMVAWAKEAKAAGAEVVYLTGRTETARAGTLAELRRLGVPDADDAHLVLKPKASTKTAPWKSQLLSQWAGQSHLGWFVTESRRDVAQVQADHPELPCLLLDNPYERGGTPVRADTPVLPAMIRGPK